MEILETPNNNNGETPITTEPDIQNPNNGETTTPDELDIFFEDIDSACSTPYVSAPSSPSLAAAPPLSAFFYSAPSSPMHFILTTSNLNSISTTTEKSPPSISTPFEFEFAARTMSSADELFLNGQIRPMKLPVLPPLLDLDEITDKNCCQQDKLIVRGRDLELSDRSSLRRRSRSMSPLRSKSSQWREYDDEKKDTKEAKFGIEDVENKKNEEARETTPSGSSSRSSSAGRSSKRWEFLKEFLYRSKSEGRNNGRKIWSNLSFSPVKDKKMPTSAMMVSEKTTATASESRRSKKAVGGKGMGKRRAGLSAHELHYKENRVLAEEMRKKTFLPYRQGLIGCLGFNSKSYGAMNGFARALNPLSSR